VSDLNHELPPATPESRPSFDESGTSEPRRPFREGLPPAFRMRADAHYVEQLDAPALALTIQYVAAHAIDVSDAPGADVPPALAESIKRHGILEPLIVQRNNGTYKTISGRRRLAAARAVGLRDVPCLVHHIGDDKAHALREALGTAAPTTEPAPQSDLAALAEAQMADALSAVMTCARLLSPSTPGLARGVAVDLVQAEVWRACCLVQATRVVRAGVTRAAGCVFPRELAQRVVESAEAERRLRSLSIDTAVTVTDSRPLSGDAALLHHTVSSLLLSTMALLDGVAGAVGGKSVSLDVDAADGRFVLSVAQDRLVFDEPPIDRLAASSQIDTRFVPVALSIVALRRIAEVHGGRVSVQRMGGGTRVSMELPLDVNSR